MALERDVYMQVALCQLKYRQILVTDLEHSQEECVSILVITLCGNLLHIVMAALAGRQRPTIAEQRTMN